MKALPTLLPPKKPTICLGEVFSTETDRNASSYICGDRSNQSNERCWTITQVQFREGRSLELTFPADTIGLWCYVKNRPLRNGGKLPKPKTYVMSFCRPLGFVFLICTMRAVGSVIVKHFFVKMWNLFKSRMCKREWRGAGWSSNNHGNTGAESSGHSLCAGHRSAAHTCHLS